MYLNAVLHLSIKNALSLTVNIESDALHYLDAAHLLFEDYKGLLDYYTRKAVEFRLTKIYDVSCKYEEETWSYR